MLFHRPTHINYSSDEPKRYEKLTCGNGAFLNITCTTVIDILQFINYGFGKIFLVLTIKGTIGLFRV